MFANSIIFLCNIMHSRAVVVVKWSVCSRSTTTIQVQIPLKPTVFFCKICVWKERKYTKKRPELVHFFKNICIQWEPFWIYFCEMHKNVSRTHDCTFTIIRGQPNSNVLFKKLDIFFCSKFQKHCRCMECFTFCMIYSANNSVKKVL